MDLDSWVHLGIWTACKNYFLRRGPVTAVHVVTGPEGLQPGPLGPNAPIGFPPSVLRGCPSEVKKKTAK